MYMKNLFGSLSIIGFALMPLAANAQAAPNINDLIAQTQALIQQIDALRSRQAGSAASAPAANANYTGNVAASISSGACPSLSRTLSFGSRGSDVSSLQQFLAQDPAMYPEQSVTGYYGPLTQRAVQRWQAKNGIVSSGTPSSTGFGMVGPRTKAAMLARCGSGTTQTGVPSVVGGFIQVTPAVGNAPLTTVVTATVNTVNSCAGTTYTIDFGDGIDTRQFISTAGNCNQQVKTFTHTYTSGGVYTVTLSAGAHKTTATVTVNGSGAQTGTVDSIHPSVASGTVPLLVTFTGTVQANDAGICTADCVDVINFGDGASLSVPLPARQQGYQSYTTYIVSHTYKQPGAYIASLTSSASSSPSGDVQAFANTQITVSGSPVVVVPPSLTIRAGTNAVAQGGILPLSWASQNAASSSAVGLWLVNVLTGSIYPLAMTLNTSGNINAPIPASANEGTVPPVGAYVALGKIYTPADAILTGTPPTYVALGRSDTFNILAGTTATSSLPASGGTYTILSVATGVGGNQSAVTMQISYPTCSTYMIDWGDGKPAQSGGGATSGCATQTSTLLTHTYQQNGTMIIRLLNGSGVQQATATLAISNAGTIGNYGMTSVTSGVGGNALNVSVQLTVPACPSYKLEWGDNSTAITQSAPSGCTGTTRETPTFTHTYALDGTYTIKLSDGAGALQSSSSIRLTSQ